MNPTEPVENQMLRPKNFHGKVLARAFVWKLCRKRRFPLGFGRPPGLLIGRDPPLRIRTRETRGWPIGGTKAAANPFASRKGPWAFPAMLLRLGAPAGTTVAHGGPMASTNLSLPTRSHRDNTVSGGPVSGTFQIFAEFLHCAFEITYFHNPLGLHWHKTSMFPGSWRGAQRNLGLDTSP